MSDVNLKYEKLGGLLETAGKPSGCPEQNAEVQKEASSVLQWLESRGSPERHGRLFILNQDRDSESPG